LCPTFRLYIDESGDHTYGRAEKQPFILRHKETVILNTTIDANRKEMMKNRDNFLFLKNRNCPYFQGCLTKRRTNRQQKRELELLRGKIYSGE